MRSAFMGVVTFVFGISLFLYGCTATQKQSAEKALDKVATTANAVASGAAAIGAANPATLPYTNIIISVAGAILAAERLIVGGVKMLPTKSDEKSTEK